MDRKSNRESGIPLVAWTKIWSGTNPYGQASAWGWTILALLLDYMDRGGVQDSSDFLANPLSPREIVCRLPGTACALSRSLRASERSSSPSC